jgi:hypothetical protein
MGLLRTASEANGIEGPTPCDTSAVSAAYSALALHVGPAPSALRLKTTALDEGEEPEADDTPVVRPPR